ncbi:uncharacterized protein LOC135379149 [Ornithodoros turicata]|uniref:uncharacterized protein LOC135379149 n=1 Tax=Ornithodoros turicata TaxID=34597 RepID=UPI0031392C4F
MESGTDTSSDVGHDMVATNRDEEHRTQSPESAQGDESSAPSELDHVRQLALLLLKWKESKRLPETTANEIANDIICYVQGLADHLMTKPAQEVPELMSSICDEMQTLATNRGRTEYWQTYLPFIEPRAVLLGTNERGRQVVFHYVPICDVLRHVLEDPETYSSFCCSDREEGYLSSVFDGTAFRDHSYFQGDDGKICIQLYADEFEVCDPLGSKRGKHKLLGVYFSILNIAQRSRSTLSQIHLVLLVKDKHASAYGLRKVFAPLLEDVAKLEREGIAVHGRVLNGTIFIMTGDNLSSHRIGGFKCSFSAGRICRFCLALRNETSHKHLESDFVLRSPEGHCHHLEMLTSGMPAVSLYGVREACAITTSGFHPTEHFPPDVMHDVFEGVIPFAMRHIMKSLVSSGLFSLNHLNERLETYNYEAAA